MFISVFGKKIYYEMYGAEHSDTLLYLHGGPGASCLDFVNQAKALSSKMRIIIFDQLGVLRSDAIAEDEDYSMEYQVEMLEEMRKIFDIKKWSILGHSYGGMLAVLYANRYPNSICKVILECPSLLFEDSCKSIAEYLSEHIKSLNNQAASELYDKIKTTNDEFGQESVYDILTLLNYVTDPKLRNYLHGISFQEYQKNMDTNGITEEMWAKANGHLTKLLEIQPTQNNSLTKRVTMLDNFLPMISKITLPILLINGKYDPVCTMYQTKYLIDNTPNVTQVVFENSGHFPRIEEAMKFTDVIFDFI